MRVLLDACVPRPLRQKLPGHLCKTAQEMNWATKKNGQLLRAAERHFDVLITCDQNMKYQQNLKGRHLAIIALPTNFLPAVMSMGGKVAAALARIQPGDYIEISP